MIGRNSHHRMLAMGRRSPASHLDEAHRLGCRGSCLRVGVCDLGVYTLYQLRLAARGPRDPDGVSWDETDTSHQSRRSVGCRNHREVSDARTNS
jgi:hypothetical protein